MIASYQASGQVSIGWDGRFQALSQRDYPFLRPTADIQGPGGSQDVTEAVSFTPGMKPPIWIVARFSSNSAIYVAKPGAQPKVAAFLTGSDEQVYWVQRLSNT